MYILRYECEYDSLDVYIGDIRYMYMYICLGGSYIDVLNVVIRSMQFVAHGLASWAICLYMYVCVYNQCRHVLGFSIIRTEGFESVHTSTPYILPLHPVIGLS
jgi:hypothetical protein